MYRWKYYKFLLIWFINGKKIKKKEKQIWKILIILIINSKIIKIYKNNKKISDHNIQQSHNFIRKNCKDWLFCVIRWLKIKLEY